jgi:Flp pilus assembly protein CpaB
MAIDQSSGISRRVVAIVVAVVVAVASVVGLFFLVQSQTKSNGTGSYVGVWVTKDQLVAGATIGANDVQVVQRDPATLPTNYLDSGKVVVGETMVVASAPGTVLTQTTVATAALPALSIPNDWVAMAIPNSAQLGVAGYVQPGDHIDIIADVSQYSSNSSAGLAVRYVLQDIAVLKVGPSGAGAAGSLMVVALPRAQAEELSYLDAIQPKPPILTYVLRNANQSSKIDPHTGLPEDPIYLSSGSLTPSNPKAHLITLTVTGQSSTVASALASALSAQKSLDAAFVKAQKTVTLPYGISVSDNNPTIDIFSAVSSPGAITAYATTTVDVDSANDSRVVDPAVVSIALSIAHQFGATIGYSPGTPTDETVTSNQLTCLFPPNGSAAFNISNC